MSDKDLKEQILYLQHDVKALKEETKDRNTRIIALENENRRLYDVIEHNNDIIDITKKSLNIINRLSER